MLELAIKARHDKERHHPPAALVAVVQPLDRGRKINPEKDRRSPAMDDYGNNTDLRQRAKRCRIDDEEYVVEIEAERCRAAEQLADACDQATQEDHPADDDQGRQPAFGAVNAALEAEQKPGPVHRCLRPAAEGRKSGDWSRRRTLRFENGKAWVNRRTERGYLAPQAGEGKGASSCLNP